MTFEALNYTPLLPLLFLVAVFFYNIGRHAGVHASNEQAQKAYREIIETQIYPISTKGKPKGDDIVKKYFPQVKC